MLARVPPADLLVPLTLVVGDEELLVSRAVAEVVAAARETDPDVDVRDLPASALDAGQLVELVSPSLFARRRVLVLRGAQDVGRDVAVELTAYAASPAADAHLVVTHGGGAKGKALLDVLAKAGARRVACVRLSRPSEREQFVRAEFHRAGRRITDDGVRALLDAVGSDLRALASASGQLAADTEGPIDGETVRRYHSGRAEVTGFEIADRAVEGRTGRALELLRWALATGAPEVLLNAALAGALRNLAKLGSAPRGLSENELARHVGAPPWKVRQLRAQLRGWTPEALTAAIRAVADADLAIKGGAASPAYALERAVLAIGAAREGRR
jgi:DNA polymerase-3 subunit delta